MTFKSIEKALEREIQSPPARTAFDNAKKKHPELRSISDPNECVKILRDPKKMLAKQKLLFVVMKEFQMRKASVWSAILTLGFYPFLMNCRHFILTLDRQQRDEKDMLIFESFLDAANSIQLNADKYNLLIFNLIESTKRNIGRRKSNHFTKCSTELAHSNSFWEEYGGAHALPEDMVAAKEIFELAAKELKSTKSSEYDNIDIVEVFVLTAAYGERVTDYVRERLGDVDEATFNRVCNRIRKTKERLQKKMQAYTVK